MRRRVVIAAAFAVAVGLGHLPASGDEFLTWDFTCVQNNIWGESGTPERAAECARLCATYISLNCAEPDGPSVGEQLECLVDPRSSEGKPYDYCWQIRMAYCKWEQAYCH